MDFFSRGLQEEYRRQGIVIQVSCWQTVILVLASRNFAPSPLEASKSAGRKQLAGLLGQRALCRHRVARL